MFTLYTWTTPNGRKVSIGLEEMGLAYEVKPIHIGKGEQFAPDFLKVAPNNRIPAIVDHDAPGGPLPLFESGAILIYLAEKTGKFLAASGPARYHALQWLMWQMGGVGPMFGQTHHFLRYAPEKVDYAIGRYTRETARLYGVLNARLGKHEYLAGEYSIADIATFPWVARHEWHDVALASYPHVLRWFKAVANRPAVQRGMAVPS